MINEAEDLESVKEVSVEPASQEDILNQSKNVAVKISMLRYSLAFILCGLAAGLGASSFLLLRNREIQTFHGEFQSATIQSTRSISQSLRKIYLAATLINDIYNTEIDVKPEMLPNYTIPGFEKIVHNINKLSNARVTSFSPLLTTKTRGSWEAYAAQNVGLLMGPPSLTVSTNSSWIVADGIYTIINGKPSKAPLVAVASSHPDLLFPIWNIAPIVNNSAAIMYDPHSDRGSRTKAIDRVVDTMQGAPSDVVQLVFDTVRFRPSTVLYFPVTNSSSEMVGLLGIAFTWDQVFENVLPSYLNRIYCVVSTSTISFTLSFANGLVTVLGEGDLHDRAFDQYASDIVTGTSGSEVGVELEGYKITLYPSDALYSTYITSYPQNVCVGAVVIIAFTALVFTLYVYLVNIRQANLEEVATRSLIRDTSRDAVLQSKKIYVRYISHEMRTPLNVAFLGLKLLNKDLARDPVNSDRLETVADISKACHMALSILNDLLNYDKLEDGTLLIERQRMVALPFILESTEVLNLQAKEKGLVLLFDVYDSPSQEKLKNKELLDSITDSFKESSQLKCSMGRRTADPPGGISSYLSPSDHINVDPYKMKQVIGNLISNAIKFTPVGQSVTIKARKVMPDLRNVRYKSSSSVSSKSMLSKLKRQPLQKEINHDRLLKKLGFLGRYPSAKDSDHDIESAETNPSGHDDSKPHSICSSGYLVVEVSDSGVGMAPEDSKRLFKEIVQFNPSKLQAGGGSGLGMMITKGIVDLHGGEISVYSAGEGFGSTFTLKIPLLDTPDLSRRDSLAGDERVPSERKSSLMNLYADKVDPPMKAISGQWDEEKGRNGTDDIDEGNEREDKLNEEDVRYRVSLGALLHPDDLANTDSTLKFRAGVSPLTPPTPISELLRIPQNILDQAKFGLITESSKNGLLTPGKSDRNYTILVVDDSKLNRRMLIKSLKAGFHRCEEAEDGDEAVNMVREKLTAGADIYDAILMDFMMPKMDGPTATKVIRDMGYMGIIIGVTGNALPSDVNHFTTSGADMVLLKPVDMDALQGALLSLLSEYTGPASV